MASLKIGILGIGAIGSVIGSLLYDNEDLSINYYTRKFQKEIRILANGERLVIPIDSTSKVAEEVSLDWLVICLKEYHYAGAVDLLKSIITPKTRVVVIRNGLNLYQSAIQYTGRDKILECIIDCPSELRNDGWYHQYRAPILSTPQSLLADEFSEFFKDKKITINQVEDFKTASWKKLIESSSLGGILALTGETAWIFEDSELISLYLNVVEEGILVAQKDGANIDNNYKTILLEKLKSYPKDKGSSMLSDRLNGHPIELMAKNGMVSKLGKEHGIATPTNDMICQLLKFTNKKSRVLILKNAPLVLVKN